MTTWKQSTIAAIVVVTAIVVGGLLQVWSLKNSATTEVTGMVLSYEGTKVVLTNGTSFVLAPGARVGQNLPPIQGSDLKVGDIVTVVGRPGIDSTLATTIGLLPGRLIDGLTEGWTASSNGEVVEIGSINTVWPGGCRLAFRVSEDQVEEDLVEYSTDTRFTRLQDTSRIDLKPGARITASVSNGVAGFIHLQGKGGAMR